MRKLVLHSVEQPRRKPYLPRTYPRLRCGHSIRPVTKGRPRCSGLALQKLCRELGQPGKNINDDIKALVADGLDPLVQQAADSIRVVGNKAVHPGEIDLLEDPATAEKLFGILNLITERMISFPKHVKDFYEELPEKERKKIEKRDGGIDQSVRK